MAGKGFVLRIIDLTDSSSIKESLNRAFDIPALCYMGFNGQGSEFGLPPYNAYENVNKPYIGICVDHPIAHHDRLLEAQLFYTFIDRSHVAYATEVYGGSSYGFLPHAGSEARNIFSDRPFDVVFLGSYNSPHERKRTWQGMPKSKVIFMTTHLLIEKAILHFKARSHTNWRKTFVCFYRIAIFDNKLRQKEPLSSKANTRGQIALKACFPWQLLLLVFVTCSVSLFT